MKKQLKKLELSKKVVSNFQTIYGGRPPKTRDRRCEDQAPEPPSETGFTSYCSVIVC